MARLAASQAERKRQNGSQHNGKEDDELTQSSTQAIFDPRRAGRNNSGLSDEDISDILCILHPCTPAAFAAVSMTAKRAPQHILQRSHARNVLAGGPVSGSEEATFILEHDDDHDYQAQDLALRFSSQTNRPALGFTFGRNPINDIVFNIDSMKRISNMHFRIFVNNHGVIMCEDTSTNGTLVDEWHLKAKEVNRNTHMISAGSIIQILSPIPNDIIKFVVRIPSRNGHVDDFTAKFQAYMVHVKAAEQREAAMNLAKGKNGKQPDPNDLLAVSSMKPALPDSSYGMKWGGGDEYNVVAHLGKGAFATVYKLATKHDGQFFAVKELEKRRFMKNGSLDQRVQNELQIMQDLRHPNIVQYVDFHDMDHHLYIIMEFVGCGDLQEYLNEKGVLSEIHARTMSRQVLSALAYLHDKKITHRDIKPDNILIANENPFEVKLSDFGLSKVVKNNETFLKTFCGTLLYCAPEVFPHYENHSSIRGTKRPRRGGNKPVAHAYSQSVDIWSYAAVLWFSLCHQPPIEGVADQTGKAMFNKIMETTLDITPLKEVNASDDLIDLILKMLNTDPSLRPSERACLRHRWLADGSDVPEPEVDAELGAIEEEDEIVEDQEVDFSQLSLHDSEIEDPRGQDLQDESSNESQEKDSFDPRNPKRIRGPINVQHPEVRPDSSDEIADRSFPFVFDERDPALELHGGQNPGENRAGEHRLFGEISRTAFQSSGVLGTHPKAAWMDTNDDYSTNPNTNTGEPIANTGSQPHIDIAHLQRDEGGSVVLRALAGAQASPSLLGAESLVRDLNMGSPGSNSSPAKGSQILPQTPERYRAPSVLHSGLQESPQDPPEEITPKPPPFSRRIQLNLPSDYLPVIQQPDQSEEQAMAGAEEQNRFQVSAAASETSLPPTEAGSQVAPVGSGAVPEPPIVAPSAMPSADNFLRPPRCLGKLTSTPDSFTSITLRLESRLTNWGRDPANTHVYENKLDTRIPKRAICIWFYAKGIEDADKRGDDWTTVSGLHTIISTESTAGIWVNGVPLKKGKEGTLFGRLYTGDEIVVYMSRDGKERLAFTTEFFHGEGKERRPGGGARFSVQRESRGAKTVEEK